MIVSSYSMTQNILSKRTIQQLIQQKYIEEIQQIEHIVIQRIKKEFYEYNEEDFTMNLYDCEINVHYEELTAIITVTGKYQFISCLIYNDSYGTIENYYYIG